MSGIYDDAYLRANADALRAEDDAALHAFNTCHRLTPDERDDLATFVATRRPELIRYGARLEPPTWPTATSTSTNTPSRATTSTRVQVSTTPRRSSSGSLSASASGPASASSRGRSSRPGARLLVDGGAWLLLFALLAAWYLAVRAVGGA